MNRSIIKLEDNMDEKKCCYCIEEANNIVIGKYVCYCNHVSEKDIIRAIENGATTVESVIKVTSAMKNSNCEVNNQKGTFTGGAYRYRKENMIL
ncbi:hypothetical protein J2Z76_000645 [Sedimentibacter acidaminivorans]|uniref:BFD-like [2Fe-2S]-binding domain-containing protein n=1 Tax=Sedimentibacter acidaminivorans TaxID=913099 RepID=A0ABS4GB82_9FIRM|nr:(2Fe-2S)-binding protein [Sedimentibacter acidaminivorans]MBP1924792.1 hypothetical protein [Sedimentibacter acidaminivorans]